MIYVCYCTKRGVRGLSTANVKDFSAIHWYIFNWNRYNFWVYLICIQFLIIGNNFDPNLTMYLSNTFMNENLIACQYVINTTVNKCAPVWTLYIACRANICGQMRLLQRKQHLCESAVQYFRKYKFASKLYTEKKIQKIAEISNEESAAWFF